MRKVALAAALTMRYNRIHGFFVRFFIPSALNKGAVSGSLTHSFSKAIHLFFSVSICISLTLYFL